MDEIYLTNVPNGLLSKKTDKKGKEHYNLRMKYEKSEGGNGYGVANIPVDSVTQTSPKFSKITLDKNKKYSVFYTNADGQFNVDWLHGDNLKKSFDATRAPKQPVQQAVASTVADNHTDITNDVVNDYGDDLAF